MYFWINIIIYVHTSNFIYAYIPFYIFENICDFLAKWNILLHLVPVVALFR